MNLHNWTPVLTSAKLSVRLNCRIYAKMECHQPTGSFKVRGIGHLLRTHVKGGETDFISSSGGNAGIAVAYCAAKLGVKATVVVPETTNNLILETLASYGANVFIHGKVWDQADLRAKELVAESGGIYVSPFDDSLLWDGHSTMIDECVSQIEQPDAVVVSVGGGGLLCGVLQGMHRNAWEHVPIIAVETVGADSFAASCAAGRLVTLESIRSVAKSLGACRVSPEALAWTYKHQIRNVVLPDRSAIQSCKTFAEHFRVLVEPACGVSLAAVEAHVPELNGCNSVLVIACGGAAIN